MEKRYTNPETETVQLSMVYITGGPQGHISIVAKPDSILTEDGERNVSYPRCFIFFRMFRSILL